MNQFEIWNQVYSREIQKNEWPFTSVVSLIEKYLPIIKINNTRTMKFFEIGFGFGNNLSYLLTKTPEVYGVELSTYAFAKATQKYQNLEKNLSNSSILEYNLGELEYDLILDRAALTHLSSSEQKFVIPKIYRSLKPGGLFISIDNFGKESSDYIELTEEKKNDTVMNFIGGYFRDLGQVTFVNEFQLREKFKDWDILQIDRMYFENRFKKDQEIEGVCARRSLETWNVVVRKPL